MVFGSIADILIQWESIGFFHYVLPFLLVFAVVFGVLSYMKIFGDSRAVHIIIALVLGLLSLRLNFFSEFLAQVAPRLGVGLTVLLLILILVGLFIPEGSEKTIGWILFAVGAVIAIIILSQLYNLFGYLGGGMGFTTNELIGWVVMLGFLIGVIVVIVVGTRKDTTKGQLVPLWGQKQ